MMEQEKLITQCSGISAHLSHTQPETASKKGNLMKDGGGTGVDQTMQR